VAPKEIIPFKKARKIFFDKATREVILRNEELFNELLLLLVDATVLFHC